jgi:uncharacterized tellurite resistance protein B-like protein
MLKTLRTLLSELTADGERPGRLAPEDDRLAAAALLVHAAAIDGDTSPAERRRLLAVVRERFDLDEAGADELMRAARKAERDAVDLYRFTRVLNSALDEEGRRRLVEMMWEIAHADGRVGELEHNLIWRAADLIGVGSRERILIGQRVAARRGAKPA